MTISGGFHRPRRGLSLVYSWMFALIPTFISNNLTTDGPKLPTRLHPTSHLDGLRGLASWIVFAYHYTDYNHKSFLPLYGSNSANVGSSWLQLPIIRLLYSGPPMVHLFFVISGFALAFRPLKSLYDYSTFSTRPSTKGIAKCHETLTSAAFRRPFRLLIPPMVQTLTTVLILQSGINSGWKKPKDTMAEQLMDWILDGIYNIGWPWTFDKRNIKSRYNPHLWTIPIELSHSLFLFLVILIVSKLRTARLRRFTLALFMFYTLVVSGHCSAFEFIGGAFLADLHLARDFERAVAGEKLISLDGSLAIDDQRLQSRFAAVIKTMVRLMAVSASAVIFCYPLRKGDMTEGYTWLSSMAPASFGKDDGVRFWYAMAAFGSVWALSRLSIARRILNSRVAQYAGKTSFASYILQHTILNLMQSRIMGSDFRPATKDKAAQPGWGLRGLTGQQNQIQRTACWVIGLVMIGSVVLVVADVFTRIVDGPVVRFAQRIEKWAFVRKSLSS